MSVIAGQSLTADFTVVGSTGALTNADSTPTGTLVINGTDNAASVTVTNKTTGTYKAAVTVPTTVAIGDVVQLRANATVSSVASGGYIFTGTVDVPTAYAGRTWYVRTTGSNSNHGRSPDAPKLTIAAAVTAASSGDIIDIGAGTFTEKVDIETAQKSLTLRGKNATETIITQSGTSNDTGGAADHCIVAWHGCTFERLRITQTATGDAAGQGIRAYQKTDVVVRDCYIESNYDCIYLAEAVNWTVQRCYLVGRYDCLNTEDSYVGLCEDCYITTTCAANYSDAMRCVIMSGSVGVKIRRCVLSTFRSSSVGTTNATYGVHGGQNYQIEDCNINTVSTDASNSGNLGCLHANTSSAEVTISGVVFLTSNSGSGTTRHVRNGKFVDQGSNIDISLVHSSNTTYTPAYSDVKRWLGTAAATPTVAGIPKVETPAADIRSALGMASANLDTQLSALLTNNGTGARTVTITVNDGSTALENAIVRMTEGVHSYTATTNASGIATFNLDDATYTVSISKSGYSYAGTTLVVDGTETATYSMTAVTVSPPSDPAVTRCYTYTKDRGGAVQSGVKVYYKLISGPGTTALSHASTETYVTSDTDGYAYFDIVKSSTIKIRRGGGDWSDDISVGTASTKALPELLGTP